MPVTVISPVVAGIPEFAVGGETATSCRQSRRVKSESGSPEGAQQKKRRITNGFENEVQARMR